MKHLENLNERQREAVLHTDGPLLIVAGAGAGKTKTITHRIAHLISKGVPARSILAVTFTNKAAGGMRERVQSLLPREKGGLPLIATFHSLGVRILREFHERAGIPRGFSIWDRDDSVRAIKKTLQKLGTEEWKPSAILSVISREKGNGTDFKEYSQHNHSRFERAVADIWKEYEESLVKEGALDFDDLLLRTQQLLSGSEEVRSLLQMRWPYITIDEYQDTNRSQYEIARLLAGERRNICVVADGDQNIYSWRGASVAHMLSFEKQFPGTKIVLLEENYRSTRTILAAANMIIEKNTQRIPKNLFTQRETGGPIGVYLARTEGDEAWFVAENVRLLMEKGTPASEIAVLYRENFQSRVLEEAFLAAGIPYRVLGTRFFERKEVKDVLSYLRAALNPRSTSDLARIVSSPPRGIGAVTLAKMLAGNDDVLPPSARAKARAFRAALAAIEHAVKTLPASETVYFAFESSGMEKHFKESQRGGGEREDGSERIDNVRELVNLSTKYDFEAPPAGIERLLEEAALMTDQDSLDKNEGGAMLMTVHASKGLEFDVVFVTGLEQGLFPESRDDNSDPEEERRLFYVALTRARKQIFLSSAGERSKWGKRESTIPSEFLSDIDPRLISHMDYRDFASVRGATERIIE
ncbi:MAG: ATP-dependent DNA helicase PcrA [Parcubacteria group bacterium GW2011_GWA2_51_10]|nr:MAG: ATP-dependent DNA helicase PcrA [Parcubacteria group bacterium GW2011_GWA2_51_10]